MKIPKFRASKKTVTASGAGDLPGLVELLWLTIRALGEALQKVRTALDAENIHAARLALGELEQNHAQLARTIEGFKRERGEDLGLDR